MIGVSNHLLRKVFKVPLPFSEGDWIPRVFLLKERDGCIFDPTTYGGVIESNGFLIVGKKILVIYTPEN